MDAPARRTASASGTPAVSASRYAPPPNASIPSERGTNTGSEQRAAPQLAFGAGVDLERAVPALARERERRVERAHVAAVTGRAPWRAVRVVPDAAEQPCDVPRVGEPAIRACVTPPRARRARATSSRARNVAAAAESCARRPVARRHRPHRASSCAEPRVIVPPRLDHAPPTATHGARAHARGTGQSSEWRVGQVQGALHRGPPGHEFGIIT